MGKLFLRNLKYAQAHLEGPGLCRVHHEPTIIPERPRHRLSYPVRSLRPNPYKLKPPTKTPLSSPLLPRRRNPNLAARRRRRRQRRTSRHVEPQGVEDAPVRQLPDARDDPGRPPTRGEVHGLRSPHEPRPRRLRGVPQAPAFKVFQDHRRAGGAEDARPAPSPWRGGCLHDRRGPAPARRVPRQGLRWRWRAFRHWRRSRCRPWGGHRPAAPGAARPLWPCSGRRRSGPWHDAAPDLASPNAEPLSAAGRLPTGRPPATDGYATHATWWPATDADAVSAPARSPACAIPWGPAAAVHEGTATDGATTREAGDARHATTARDEADATTAVWTTTQAWNAATAAWSTAAWTEPPAVEKPFW